MNKNKLPWVQMYDGRWILGAPQWMKDQREALRKLPPPTLEEVRQQFAASARIRAKMDAEERRKKLGL